MQKGRRVYPDSKGVLPTLEPKDYGRDGKGTWFVRPPAGHHPTLSDDQRVVEHDDGTISCTRLLRNPDASWVGWLEHGNWRDFSEKVGTESTAALTLQGSGK